MSTTHIPPRRRWPSRRRWPTIAALALLGIVLAAGLPAFVASFPDLARRSAGAQPHGLDLRLLLAQPLLLRIHIACVVCLVPLGSVMMFSRKGARFHRVAGWTFVVLMAIAAISPLLLGLMERRFFPIHLTSPMVLVLLVGGMWAARRGEVKRHRRYMLWLFYGPLLGAGALTFLPGRLMWRLFFG